MEYWINFLLLILGLIAFGFLAFAVWFVDLIKKNSYRDIDFYDGED